MPATFWTSDKIDFIKNNLHLSDAGLGEYFSASSEAIKQIRLRYGILKRHRTYLSSKEIEIMMKLYANTRTDIIAKKLNRSDKCIYSHANKLGIKKNPEFLHSADCGIFFPGHQKGNKTQYKKGNIPYNKGKKMSKETREKVKHTFFQKGHKPHNEKFDGYISTRKHKKTGTIYKVIRVSLGHFKYLHVYNWEKKNGPVPEGFIVIFKDGDTMNCDSENLKIITKAENMNRNSLYNYPEEIQQLIHTRGQLTRQINKRQEENK